MSELSTSSENNIRDERRGLLPSVGLVVAIALISWLAIALVFGVGQAGLAAAGGVGPGARGLATWVALWIAMWAAVTLAVGGGLAAGVGAWRALYPWFRRAPTPAAAARADEPAAARHPAVAEAEDVLRRTRRRPRR